MPMRAKREVHRLSEYLIEGAVGCPPPHKIFFGSSSSSPLPASTLNRQLPEYRSLSISERKILGILWNVRDDSILFSLGDIIKGALENTFPTKRFILKVISNLFDPLGVYSPRNYFQAISSRNIPTEMWMG